MNKTQMGLLVTSWTRGAEKHAFPQRACQGVRWSHINFSWVEISVYLFQVGHQWQSRKLIPPKSSLVNQWNQFELPTGGWATKPSSWQVLASYMPWKRKAGPWDPLLYSPRSLPSICQGNVSSWQPHAGNPSCFDFNTASGMLWLEGVVPQ